MASEDLFLRSDVAKSETSPSENLRLRTEASKSQADLTIEQTATESLLVTDIAAEIQFDLVIEQPATESLLVTDLAGSVQFDLVIDQVATESLLVTDIAAEIQFDLVIEQTATESLLITDIPASVEFGFIVDQTSTGPLLITDIAAEIQFDLIIEQTSTESLLVTDSVGTVELVYLIEQTATESFLITLNAAEVIFDVTIEQTATESLLITDNLSVVSFVRGPYERTGNKVRTRFKTSVADALSIPVQYDNITIDPPNSGLWVDLAVVQQSTEKRTTGANQAYELRGELVATVRGPLSTGDFELRSVADTILAAFTGQRLDRIEYGGGRSSPVERDGRWYRLAVTVPFRFSFKQRVLHRRVDPVTLGSVQAGDSIRSWFGDQVADAESISTQYDNAPFDQPDASRWIRFSVLEGEAQYVGKRGDLMVHRHVGMATAQIFTPLQTGDGTALETADTIADVFRSVTVDGITFRTPQVRTIGEGRSGKWWTITVATPYTYETTSST